MAVTKHPTGCQCWGCRRKARLRRRHKVGISFQTFILILIVTLAVGMIVSVGTDSERPEHAGWVAR